MNMSEVECKYETDMVVIGLHLGSEDIGIYTHSSDILNITLSI